MLAGKSEKFGKNFKNSWTLRGSRGPPFPIQGHKVIKQFIYRKSIAKMSKGRHSYKKRDELQTLSITATTPPPLVANRLFEYVWIIFNTQSRLIKVLLFLRLQRLNKKIIYKLQSVQSA